MARFRPKKRKRRGASKNPISNRSRQRIQSRVGSTYESLEPRRLLAGDVALASPVSELLAPSTAVGDSQFAATTGANIRNSVVSADGRFVVFQSLASDLVENDDNNQSDIFRYDRQTGTVELVSVNFDGTGSGSGASTDPVISADGSVVAFESTANDLLSTSTNFGTEIFVRNFTTGTTELVSIELDGLDNSGGNSRDPIISADGNVVAFVSNNNDLAGNDNGVGGNTNDLFARNLTTNTTTLVNVDFAGQVSGDGGSGDGTPSVHAINADGSVIAFQNSINGTTNLVDVATSGTDVFARNLIANTTTLVSVNTSGDGVSASNGSATNPSISADGTIVVFQSNNVDLSSLDDDTQNDVFAFNLNTGNTTLVSINDAGDDSGSGSSTNPTISADGTTIAFQSFANDLVPAGQDTNFTFLTDVFAFRFDDATATTGTTTLVSINSTGDGSGSGNSNDPVISADGSVIAFESAANNLVDTPTPVGNVFVRDLNLESTTVVSSGQFGIGGANEDIAISSDGSTVAFESTAPDLVDGDFNGDRDIFVGSVAADSPLEVASRVLPANASATANGISRFLASNQSNFNQSISANGRFLVFESLASNIVPGDNNGAFDVFRYDLLNDVVELVSVNRDGDGTGNQQSGRPVISADGSIVAFESSASDLADLPSTGPEIFVRNFDTGETSLVSINFDGNGSGTSTSSAPVISADGSVVAFLSNSSNLIPGISGNQVYSRDLNEQTTSLVTVNVDGTGTIGSTIANVSISDDGSIVVFDSSATDLSPLDNDTSRDVFARDLVNSTTILVSTNSTGDGSGDAASSLPIISGDGSTIVFSSTATNILQLGSDTSADLFARNINTNVTSLVNTNFAGEDPSNGLFEDPDISFDGSVVVFESTSSNLVEIDSTTSRDVFARNLDLGTTTLVSVNTDGTSSGGGQSVDPVISDDGTIVAFASTGSSLIDDNSNADGSSNAFMRDLTSGITTLASPSLEGTDDTGAAGNSDEPVLSADGLVVAFESNVDNLVESDGNDLQDVFALSFNTAPVILEQTFATPEDDDGTAAFASVVATDAESAITYAITGGDSNLFEIDVVTGAINVVPGTDLDFETNPQFTIAVTVTDTFGLTAVADVTINLIDVNEAPVIPVNGLADRAFDEDTTLTISAAELEGLLGQPLDEDFSDPNSVLDTGISITDDSGTQLFAAAIDLVNLADVSFTPPQDFFGQLTATITVTDPDGLSDSTTFDITVNPVNDAPVLTDGVVADQSGDEDTTVTVNAADLTALLGSSLDVDNTNSELVADISITDDSGAELFAAAIDLSNLADISFTPPQDFFGDLTATITVADPDGLSDSTIFTITVNPINDAPVLADGVVADQSVDEDTTFTIGVAELTSLLGSSLDVDNANSELDAGISITDDSGAEVFGTAIDLTNLADINFTPPQDFFGNLTATITVADPDGLSDSTTFGITVNPVNDAPVLTDGVVADQSSDEDTTVTVNAADLTALLGSSLDVDNTNSELVADISIADDSGAVVFASSIDLGKLADISFTPPQDFFGDLTATITVADPDGLSDFTTFVITVNPVNDAPVITSGNQFDVFENTTSVASIAAVDIEQSSKEIEFSVASTLDGAFFEFANTNELQFISAPDFELPQDLDNDNVYEIEIVANDGFTTTSQVIEITVIDVDETPPTVDIIDVTPDPRNTAVGIVNIVFNEAVTGVDISDFVLTRDGTKIDISTLSVNAQSATEYSIDLSTVTDTSGNYELRLESDGSQIADLAGNALETSVIDQFMIDIAGPTVESIVINNGEVQRSIVSSLTVTFSEVVNVTAKSFEIENTTTGEFFTPLLQITNVKGQTVVELTFAGPGIIGGSLPDGDYSIVVFDSVTDTLGNQLDGDEDGKNGGDAKDEFFRLFGDINADRDVDVDDFIEFRSTVFGKIQDLAFDFNGDGVVNIIDFFQFRSRFFS